MAKRPVFIPLYDGKSLSKEELIDFKWSNGFAEVQKKKNIKALHDAAKHVGVKNILEISSKSEEEIGRRLSAFSLKIEIAGDLFPLESVYQGSKVFEETGPHPEIFQYKPRDAKKFISELGCRRLKEYKLLGTSYLLTPPNAFYDWLYIRSLVSHYEWIEQNMTFNAFTDIEFNPKKQINCQARAFAEFMSLMKRKQLSKASSNFSYFCSKII